MFGIGLVCLILASVAGWTGLVLLILRIARVTDMTLWLVFTPWMAGLALLVLGLGFIGASITNERPLGELHRIY